MEKQDSRKQSPQKVGAEEEHHKDGCRWVTRTDVEIGSVYSISPPFYKREDGGQ